jgi:RNA:NAD 2'-phosphotransferase (TPT1/KptA family)
MDQRLTRLSKRLSFVLRHHPDKIGIQLDPYGRVDLELLIKSSISTLEHQLAVNYSRNYQR